MRIEADQPCPLPDDPVLAEWATTLHDSGEWAWIVDASWQVRFITNEQRLSLAAGLDEMVPIVIDEHMFGAEMAEVRADWPTDPTMQQTWREMFSIVGGVILADTPGGKDELRSVVDPSLSGLVDGLSPSQVSARSGTVSSTGTTARRESAIVSVLRIRDADGGLRGTALLLKPSAGMNVLGMMAFHLDLGHLERMRSLTRPRRAPAAILFGDLEGSSALSRTLSTSNYFTAGRRIVRATDQCIVETGGVVGRHVGDGVVAFFPVEVFDTESAAARACICAARQIRAAMPDVASQCGLPPDHLVMRFGLHWGSTLYVGNISTAARSEVTALGDEVNETARIEACATGGRVLASKPLVERIDADDATALGISPDRVTYTQLADLPSATEKARRDAPAIAVCEL
jgi:class 3 adenylate cyclase